MENPQYSSMCIEVLRSLVPRGGALMLRGLRVVLNGFRIILEFYNPFSHSYISSVWAGNSEKMTGERKKKETQFPSGVPLLFNCVSSWGIHKEFSKIFKTCQSLLSNYCLLLFPRIYLTLQNTWVPKTHLGNYFNMPEKVLEGLTDMLG